MRLNVYKLLLVWLAVSVAWEVLRYSARQAARKARRSLKR